MQTVANDTIVDVLRHLTYTGQYASTPLYSVNHLYYTRKAHDFTSCSATVILTTMGVSTQQKQRRPLNAREIANGKISGLKLFVLPNYIKYIIKYNVN